MAEGDDKSGGFGIDGTHGWVPPTPEEAAPLFPNYEVLGIIGRGGMGAVYKARQISLDRIVALKLLPLGVSVDENFANRFRREARALAKLSHPHIIGIHDFGQTAEGHLYFAMEFVEGANLADVIRQVGLTPEQALSLAGQICAALAYAHGKGVIHRDIKPANVMIDMDSHAKVTDFGLARLTDRTVDYIGNTMTGMVMGTVGYMAPEQMLDMNVDHRADIYSLGVMLYEMLCGETPQGAFSLPSERTGCDTRIDQIVLKAMQQSPDRRYQNTTEMEAAVESARLPAPPVATHHPVVNVNAHHMAAPIPKPKKSHSGIVAASIVCVLAVAAIALINLGSRREVPSAPPPAESAVAKSVPIEPEPPSTASSTPEEPVRQLTVEEAVKRLMSTKGWEDIGITAIPDGTISVQIENRSIADLSPLAGLPVSELDTHGAPVSDLGALTGLPLRALYLDDSPVGDVSALSDLPLVKLSLSNTRVTDLSPLRNLKLQRLMLDRNAQEIDLTPLAGMNTLENLVLPEQPKQIELLRNQPNLKFISYERGEGAAKGSSTPAAEFWRSYDEKRAALLEPPPVARVVEPPKPLSATGKWLAEQESLWQSADVNEISGPFEKGAAALKKQYKTALELDVAAAANSGRAEIVAAMNAELKLLAAGGEVPREDDVTTHPMLKGRRATYRKVFAALEAERIAKAKAAHARNDAVLVKYMSLLNQRQRPDEVAEIKAKREQLAAAWLKPPPIAEATKERPFINSLGMKFVPVKIKGGPSGGQRVLFSVWETRVQDYEAFVAETKREWSKPGFPQGPTHPAVNVRLLDAQAFCEWLTERERKSGLLGADEVYRLPTDHEWSCAVGIGAREDATLPPIDKSRKIPGEFPWGDTWPPPEGTGNFSGRESTGHEIWPGQRPIPDFRDEFPETSPVGSFSANALGLYDLAGNIYEMCQPVSGGIIQRGGTFAGINPEEFLSSNRRLEKRSVSGKAFGFRLVVAVERWVPLRMSPTGNVEREGLEFMPDGWVRVVQKTGLSSPVRYKNVAMRARYRFFPGAANWLMLRDDDNENNYFSEVDASGMTATIRLGVKAKNEVQVTITPLGTFPLISPIAAGDEYKMELRAFEDEITLLVNDHVLGSVRDKTHSARGLCCFFSKSGEFQKPEIRVLDGDLTTP